MITRSAKPSQWDEEDCSYVLRELELNAFSSVVAAFRAQGVLNKFKEVVLDRLRQALCISDDEMNMEMRKSAEDEFLKRIAEVLNPSYDTYSQWALLGHKYHADFPPIPPRQIFESQRGLTVADDLLSMASKHNDAIDDSNAVLDSLAQMPSVPYVPERLRSLLRDSETLHKDRITPRSNLTDISSGQPALKVVRPPVKSRRRRSKLEATLVEETPKQESVEEGANNLKISSDTISAGSTEVPKEEAAQNGTIAHAGLQEQDTSSVLLGLIPNSKEAENMGVKDLLSKIQKQIQEEEEAKCSSLSDIVSRRKRRPKQAQPSTAECARARPFQFDPVSNGVKPPRGNPDKRPPKRSPSGSGNLCFSPPVPPSPNTVLPLSTVQLHEIDSPSCSSEAREQNCLGESHGLISSPVAINTPISCKTSQPPTNSVTLPVSFSSITKSSNQLAGIKRSRVGSFHEEKSPNLIKISRTNLVSISPSSSVTKLKLVSGDHASSLSVPNSLGASSSRVIFASPTTTINRMSVAQMRCSSTPSPVVAHILSPSPLSSRASLSPTPSTIDGVHGHDYGTSAVGISTPVQRSVYKRNVIKTGGIRVTANGVFCSTSSSSFKSPTAHVVQAKNSESNNFSQYGVDTDSSKLERREIIVGRRMPTPLLTNNPEDDVVANSSANYSERRILTGEKNYSLPGPSSGVRTFGGDPRQPNILYSNDQQPQPSYVSIVPRTSIPVKPVTCNPSPESFDVATTDEETNAPKPAFGPVPTKDQGEPLQAQELPVMDILQQSMMEIT